MIRVRLKSRFLRFGVKVGVATGACYYMAEQGVWADSKRTSEIFESVRNYCAPYMDNVTKQLPFQIPKLPESDKITYVTKQCWNDSVRSVFMFVGELPRNVPKWGCQAYRAVANNKDIKQMLEGSPPADSSISKKTD